MSDHDIERIVSYHLEPINISFHSMNPELRCRLLCNRFAGEALKKVDRLFEGGIQMNGQIVLCKGVNDGKELEYSISELTKYIPYLQSVSVVPVGLTKYREGLYPLEPFQKEEAREVLRVIHEWQERIYQEHGMHFIHAGDEWYILAEEALPEEERYDGYLQLENGVCMLRLLMDEFQKAVDALRHTECGTIPPKELSIATGKLAYCFISEMAAQVTALYPQITVHVYAIRNDFFGEMITVSGLLTGQDLLAQLKEQRLGEKLLLPQNVLKSGEAVFLDDMTLAELEKALQVPIDIVKSSGQDFLDAILL